MFYDKIRDKWLVLILPLSFCFSYLLDLLIFYLGLGYQKNFIQVYGYMAGCSVFALACGLTMLQELKRTSLKKCEYVALAAIVVFYVLGYLTAVFRFGLFSDLVFRAEILIVLGLPLPLAAVCVAKKDGLKSFFSVMERLSFFAFPAYFAYFNGAVFNCHIPDTFRGLGMIDYMSLASGIMPFIVSHIQQFVDGKELYLPFWNKPLPKGQWIRGAVIFIYWIAIIGTGTRGIYLSMMGYLILLVPVRLMYRKKIKRALCVSVSLLIIILFNMFVWAPPGLDGVRRMDVFFDGLADGELVTTSESYLVQQNLDNLVAADGDQRVANRREEPTTEASTVDFEITPENIGDLNLFFGSRGTLFKLAIKEFLKAPWTGMGPLGYMYKYGIYPHNAVLELLCELGIVGFSVVMALIVYVLVKLLLIAKKRPELPGFVMLLLVYAMQMCMSGTVWSSGALIGAVVYGLLCPWPEKTEKATERSLAE